MRRTLRVMHIAPHHSPLRESSTGIAVHRHARALAQAGHDVAVVIFPRNSTGANAARTPVPPEHDRVDGFSTYVFPEQSSIHDLHALARELRPSLLHYHQRPYVDIAHEIAARLGVPV